MITTQQHIRFRIMAETYRIALERGVFDVPDAEQSYADLAARLDECRREAERRIRGDA